MFTNASIAFAAENPIVLDLESIYEEHKDDEQYKLMRSEYGEEYAEKFLKEVLKGRIESGIAPVGGGGNECYQYVTNIKQRKNYNCGTKRKQQIYGKTVYSADMYDHSQYYRLWRQGRQCFRFSGTEKRNGSLYRSGRS